MGALLTLPELVRVTLVSVFPLNKVPLVSVNSVPANTRVLP